MKLHTISETLNDIAPLSLAEEWDNVGLLTGDPEQTVNSVMLTIDLTADVFAEAREAHVDLLLAYHPPIWEPLKRVVAGREPSPLLYELIRSQIAVYSFHTALDAVQGGVNDILAAVVGITQPRPLVPKTAETGRHCKLIVFVPEPDLVRVSEAMFAAGAGNIGAAGTYSKCSFRTLGIGTFECGSESDPHIGKPGSFEQVDEYRLETIVPGELLDAVVRAMRESHPYEEVAFDIIPLLDGPTSQGLGRWGDLESPIKINDLLQTIKKELKVKALGLIGSSKGKAGRAAVCAGSCGKILHQVIRHQCDFYLTGELSHHDALKLQAAGVTTVCVSHSNSERIALKTIAGRLKQVHPDISFQLSRCDRDPFHWVQE